MERRLTIAATIGLFVSMLACGSSPSSQGVVIATVRPSTDNPTSAPSVSPDVPATAAPADTPAPEPTPEPITLGQEVSTGDFRWKILEAQNLGPTFKHSDPTFPDPNAKGKFIKLRFEFLMPEGPDRGKFDIVGHITLTDAQEREYKALTSIEFIRQSQEENRCYLELVEQGQARICDAFYDVASDATGLKAKIKEGLFSEGVLVDLGL